MLDVLPYHDVFAARGRRSSDGEQKSSVEADFQVAQDLPACRVLGQVAQAGEADGKEGSAWIGMMLSLNA